jgi:hypothetical protein
VDNGNAGLAAAQSYPLFSALLHRRSRRISKGLHSVRAGDLSYTSQQKPQPLSALEEAVLLAAVGATGVTLPDRPFQSDSGENILGTPNLNMIGRAAGSPDNAQATHFFLINDTGTYFLRRLDPPSPGTPLTVADLLRQAELSKQKVVDGRLDFPRHFPYYLDSNRFLSNLPGSTILVPVVDMTRQYINALMYLLTEPDGYRPVILDDRNFYQPAGVRKWIRNGFLNKDLKLPLGILGPMRTQIEADLLLQNLMLVIQAMGLGGWIHACIAPPYLLGNPYQAKETKGLGFRHVKPPFRLLDLLRWGTFFPSVRANPVGLDGFIECMCPPYYENMSDAVDAVVALKYGPKGVYTDAAYFRGIFKNDGCDRYLREVPHYRPEVIDCAKDVCNYIYRTHGRFPAHVDAIYVPGVWIQVHHLDLHYYDQLFKDGYTETQARHQELWHPEGKHEPRSTNDERMTND